MKNIYSILIVFFASILSAVAQPTFSTDPASFTAEDEVTITVDVSATSLAGHTGDVWMWAWISEGCSAGCDAPTNIDPAGGANTEAAKMTRVSGDIYEITIIPVDFFAKSPAEIKKIGFKLKSQGWGDGKQTDTDAILNVEPLTFTPSIARVFPTKVTKDDVITLYFDQEFATSPEIKYEPGTFKVSITAYDGEGNAIGTIIKDATKENEHSHFIRVLPTFEFDTSIDIDRLNYQFIGTADENIRSSEYSIELLDLN